MENRCLHCSAKIKYACRCGSFGCDEGWMRSFCSEKCRDEYENALIPRAVEWINGLPDKERKLMAEILSEDEVIYYLWSKYMV